MHQIILYSASNQYFRLFGEARMLPNTGACSGMWSHFHECMPPVRKQCSGRLFRDCGRGGAEKNNATDKSNKKG